MELASAPLMKSHWVEASTVSTGPASGANYHQQGEVEEGWIKIWIAVKIDVDERLSYRVTTND